MHPMKLSTFPLSEIVQSWIPSPSTFKKARQLHALILLTSPTPFLFNNLITIYAKSGSPMDALKVFDTMPHRTLASYNSAISACSCSPSLVTAAWDLFLHAARVGYRPNAPTLARILRVSAAAGDHLAGAVLHSNSVSSGLHADSRVQTALLGLYSSCGDTESADRVFASMEARDVIAWNAAIHGNVRNDNAREGLWLFSQLLREGVAPTEFTFSVALSACRRLADGHMGEAIHALLVKSEFLLDTTLQNSLLVMYSSNGNFPAALKLFDELDVPELVAWNSVISGYSNIGNAGTAMKVFVNMLSVGSDRIIPDDYTLAALVSAIVDSPAELYGRPLHARIEKSGLLCSIYVSSALIDMYFNNREPEAACKIFDLISSKDHIVWTAMIVGHSRAGEGEIAMQCFYDMVTEGHKIDSFSLSSTLNSCADLGRLKQGQMIHLLALRIGYCKEMCVSGSLIDMYAKNGDLESARSAFEAVDFPDLKCWNAMLGAYGNHGNDRRVFELFEWLIGSGLDPNLVTFLSLLSACCHSGLLEHGMFCWENMVSRGLAPGPKHYSCMVNLLGRSGRLREAEDLILASPFLDGFPEMWRALLSSCVASRELDIGIHASERILIMDPDDGPTLIMLSNLYASVGRWTDVSNVRRRIRELMLDKDPGLSWIEYEDKVRVFSANDGFYLHSEDAQDELLRLHGNMKPWDDCDLINLEHMSSVD